MKQKFKSLGSVLERKDLTTVRGGGLCNDQCGNTGEYCQICVLALCVSNVVHIRPLKRKA